MYHMTSLWVSEKKYSQIRTLNLSLLRRRTYMDSSQICFGSFSRRGYRRGFHGARVFPVVFRFAPRLSERLCLAVLRVEIDRMRLMMMMMMVMMMMVMMVLMMMMMISICQDINCVRSTGIVTHTSGGSTTVLGLGFGGSTDDRYVRSGWSDDVHTWFLHPSPVQQFSRTFPPEKKTTSYPNTISRSMASHSHLSWSIMALDEKSITELTELGSR